MSLQNKIDKKSDEKIKQFINYSLNTLAKALTDTFREEYHFGEKRMERLVEQLNKRLPEGLQLKHKE